MIAQPARPTCPADAESYVFPEVKRSKHSATGSADPYGAFSRIDGRHPFKRAVPRGVVEYSARRVHGSEVVYFNFTLAREMGLLPRDHPDRLDRALCRAILRAFSLVIINEYDLQRNTRFAPDDRLPHSYMATRYLQLQHPDRRGTTSGDGRSVWNGSFTSRGVTWDVSSCGTGVTRLCPATAEEKRFFRTGSRVASYGCGTASLEEGLAAALMSETFHRNGIATERVLAVILLGNGHAIHVRAGRNLIRPSHFLVHLRQGDRQSLRALVDLFIDRQVSNGDYPRLRDSARRYRHFAEQAARTFARVAATFESEYVFCWLDWDCDNILTDGGIIDYGSVRQFGLFHREYRFDDGPRMSTTISEQRRKARHVVQNIAQIRDYLIRGERPALAGLRGDPILSLFDREFERTKNDLLLRNVGFRRELRERLLEREAGSVARFRRVHGQFERARSARGPTAVSDGLNWNAVFSTRDLLRELPQRYLRDYRPLGGGEFIAIAASSYASAADRRVTAYRARRAREFQRRYLELIEAAAGLAGRSVPLLLTELAGRSAVINRYDRITGDGALYAARRLMRCRKRLGAQRLTELIDRFVELQTLIPEKKTARAARGDDHPDVKRVLDYLIELVGELRHGL